MDAPDPQPAAGLSFADFLSGEPSGGTGNAPEAAAVVPPPLGDVAADPAAHRIAANLRRELTHQLRSSAATVLDACYRVRGSGNVGAVNYQPDIIVDAGEPDRLARLARQPQVVIEVAAAGSARAAFIESWRIHEQLPSADAYVRIDPVQMSVVVRRRQKDGSWQEEILTDANESVFLPTIHCTLGLETLYEGVFAAADEDRV